MVDWSRLSALPCYTAAVHNMKTVAKCVATMLAHLRTSGLNVDQLTCVGHSLGAHVCGIVANYLPFRMHRIIGMYKIYELSQVRFLRYVLITTTGLDFKILKAN